MLRISATSASCRNRGPLTRGVSHRRGARRRGCPHRAPAAGERCNRGELSQSVGGIREGTVTDLASPAATRLSLPRWLDARIALGVLLVLLSVVAGARVFASADR